MAWQKALGLSLIIRPLPIFFSGGAGLMLAPLYAEGEERSPHSVPQQPERQRSFFLLNRSLFQRVEDYYLVGRSRRRRKKCLVRVRNTRRGPQFTVHLGACGCRMTVCSLTNNQAMDGLVWKHDVKVGWTALEGKDHGRAQLSDLDQQHMPRSSVGT
jgi:hypothetical protein